MCLITFAWKVHPEYRLIIAANRDEQHARPSKVAHWWPDNSSILAGRDLQAGGTWLGLSRSGRFAAVTNYRELTRSTFPRSRGDLVSNYLSGGTAPTTFADSIAGDRYSGFSLLAADAQELVCVSNRGDNTTRLTPGIYGLSNASLDTPWPKLVRTKTKLQQLLDEGNLNSTRLMRMLEDRTPAPAGDIETGEIPFEVARSLSAPFIVRPEYGTRCSSVVLIANDGRIQFAERSFDSSGAVSGNEQFTYVASGEGG